MDDVELLSTEIPPSIDDDSDEDSDAETFDKHAKKEFELVQKTAVNNDPNVKSSKYGRKSSNSKITHWKDDATHKSNDRPEKIQFTKEFDFKEDLFKEYGKILSIKKQKNKNTDEDGYWKVEYEHPKYEIH